MRRHPEAPTVDALRGGHPAPPLAFPGGVSCSEGSGLPDASCLEGEATGTLGIVPDPIGRETPPDPDSLPAAGVFASWRSGTHPDPRPLMLTDGTFLDGRMRPEDLVRRDLLTRWTEALPVYTERGDTRTWERVLRCVEQSIPLYRCCEDCGRRRIVLQGRCANRACPICRHRYPRKKARELWAAIGPVSWAGHLVVTLPDTMSEKLRPEDATRLLRCVCLAVERCFDPVMPAGVAAVHWTGGSDPSKCHAHVHILWGSHGYHDGERIELPGPMLSDGMLDSLRQATGLAWGVPKELRQAKYQWRGDRASIRHCLRYLLRPQGSGSDRACATWTVRKARTMRPFGMLATGRRAKWKRTFPPWAEEMSEVVENTSDWGCPCSWRTKKHGGEQ